MSELVSFRQLGAVMPQLQLGRACTFLGPLNAACREFDVTTTARLTAFLAQLAHESHQLRYWIEMGHPSPLPERCGLCRRTGSGHPPGAQYEGRADLGNTEKGDGVRYLGRGPIQLTGRANYRSIGRALGIDLERTPELAATPGVGFRVAGEFWRSRGLNAIADDGDFELLTRRINGGLNGLQDRLRYFKAAKEAFA